MTGELFQLAEFVSAHPTPHPTPNDRPFLIVSFWPRGWWKVTPGFSSPEGAQNEIARLESDGWLHIHIVKLPEYKNEGIQI